MSARDEFARDLFLADNSSAPEGVAEKDWDDNREHHDYAYAIADGLIAKGYRKPVIVGYVVVSRGGSMIGEQFSEHASAQAKADEWTNDCKAGGVDWDYRVAEIVEAGA